MPQPPLRAVLVDDEPLARQRLTLLLDEAETPVDIVGEAGDGASAAEQIHDTTPDVVFLDIQMPMLDGFDVIDLLPEPRPQIVFVTAHEEYALDAFDVHAADYLTKPVRLSRLEDALEHVVDIIRKAGEEKGAGEGKRAGDPEAEPLKRLTAGTGSRLKVIAPADICYFEAEDKLVSAHLAEGKRYTVDFTLKTLAARLNAVEAGPTFLRTHRSALVNIDYVREMIPWFSGTYRLRLDDGSKVPVARRRVSEVMQFLGR